MKRAEPTPDSPATQSLWASKCCDRPCAKNTLTALVAAIALTSIIMGALAYTGRLDAIGQTGGIAMMATGGGLAVALLLALYFTRETALSYDEHNTYTEYLDPNEFFIYYGLTGIKSVQCRGTSGNESYEYSLWSNKDSFNEVSLATLKERAQTVND